MPTLVGLSQEQCDQFIEAFISNGMLERRGGKLYLPAEPSVDGLMERALDRVNHVLGGAAA